VNEARRLSPLVPARFNFVPADLHMEPGSRPPFQRGAGCGGLASVVRRPNRALGCEPGRERVGPILFVSMGWLGWPEDCVFENSCRGIG